MSNNQIYAFTHAENVLESVQKKAKLCEELRIHNIDGDVPGMIAGEIVPYQHTRDWQKGPWHFFINLNYRTGPTDMVSIEPGAYYIDLDLDEVNRPLKEGELEEVKVPSGDEYPHYFNEHNGFIEPLCRFSFDFIRERGFIKKRWYIKQKEDSSTIFQYMGPSDRPSEAYRVRYASPSEITGELLRLGEMDLKNHIYDFYDNRIIKP